MNNSPDDDPNSNKLSYQGRVLQFFQTQEIPCPYRAEMAKFLIVPSDDREQIPYHFYMAHNFRRDSEHIIRPNCKNCSACQSYRVNVEQFELSRRYRRNLRTNQDLRYSIESADNINHYRQLYNRYQAQRHPETSQREEDHSLESFAADFANTQLCVARDNNNAVVAVMIIDHSGDTFSAVYTFYDPDLGKRGLGTYMILQLIQTAKKHNYPYIYLGYYVADCQKLNYKANFTPGERYITALSQWV